jgi:hypothetical protein
VERRLTRRYVMHTVALLWVGLFVPNDLFELERDVIEIETRKFALPFRTPVDQQVRMAKFSMYVSEDRGKTWKHVSDHTPQDTQAVYSEAIREASFLVT